MSTLPKLSRAAPSSALTAAISAHESAEQTDAECQCEVSEGELCAHYHALIAADAAVGTVRDELRDIAETRDWSLREGPVTWSSKYGDFGHSLHVGQTSRVRGNRADFGGLTLMTDRLSPEEVRKGEEINTIAAAIARAIIDVNPNPEPAVVAAAIYMVIGAEPELMRVIAAMLPAAGCTAAH